MSQPQRMSWFDADADVDRPRPLKILAALVLAAQVLATLVLLGHASLGG